MIKLNQYPSYKKSDMKMNKKYPPPPPPTLLRTSNYHDSNGSDSFKQDCSNVKKKIHTKNKTVLETQTVGEFVLPTCFFFSMGPLGFPHRSEYF